MTQHNELAQMPELLRGYTLAVGLNENEEGVGRLGETLTPVIDIWNGRPEWALMRGETPCAIRRQIAAGAAGTGASVGLRNPAGSGICAIITEARAEFATASVGYYPEASMAGWTAVQGFTRDRRRQVRSQLSAHAQNVSVGVVAGLDELEVTGAAFTPVICLPLMLYAGQSFAIIQNTLAAAAAATIVWYERKCVLNEVRG